MRVITGVARGRRLKTLDGVDVRPTTDKVKEGMFSAIQFCIEGRRVLDLFAGSGQLGIEALSRSAESATFVDASRQAIAVVRENIDTVGFKSSARIVNSDAISFLKSCNDKFDIAFLDPPYSTGLLQSALVLTPNVMSDYGIIVCEHACDEDMPESVDGFAISKRYEYGKVAVTVYRRREDS